MYKKMLTLICYCIAGIVATTTAQDAAQVKGKVSVKNEPLPAVTVQLLFAKDSAIAQSTLSTTDGSYIFTKVVANTYIIAIQSKQYKPYFSAPLVVTNSLVVANVIVLQPVTNTLATATVVAKKPMIEVKADKTIVNVDANINNVGSNALEVLQTAPGVLVDKDGRVSLKGNSSVLIYIDGRPSYLAGNDLINMLTNMNSSQLETIEIMTNPPAKYGADGNAGIINIKTKKSKLFGFNGSIALNAGVGMGYPRFGENVTLNYRKGKVNIFGNLSHNYREGYQKLRINRKFMNEGSNVVTSIFSQTNEPERINRDYAIKTGVDYFVTKKTTIGTVVKAGISPSTTDAAGTILLNNATGILDSTTLSNATNTSNWRNFSINGNLRHVLDSTGKEFTIDVDYITYNADQTLALKNTYYKLGLPAAKGDTLLGDLPQQISIYSAKADYQMPITKKVTMETGIKTSFVNTNANATYDSIYDGIKNRAWSRTNYFNYKEYINAGYISFNKKWNDKWNAQAGLRFESTIMKGIEKTTNNSFKRSYAQLFPTLYLQYNANAKNSFILNYGRRINRPDYESLNPFVEYLDKYTYEIGNPFLQPEFAHNIEFTHSYNQWLNTTVNYNNTTQIIQMIFITDANKTETAIKKDNVASSQTLGININANLPVKKWWTTNINLGATNDAFKGFINGKYVTQQYSRATVSIDNQLKFKKGWSASVTGFFITGEMEGVLIIKPMGAMDAGISKAILKNKGSLRFNVKDVFFTQIARGYTKYNNVDINFRQLRNSRTFNLAFTYRFNKGKLKAGTQRKIGGADAEQSRVQSN